MSRSSRGPAVQELDAGGGDLGVAHRHALVVARGPSSAVAMALRRRGLGARAGPRTGDVVGRRAKAATQTRTTAAISRTRLHSRPRQLDHGLPVRPSMVATAVWKVASASCSMSSASATLRWASRISSRVKRPCA